ncbi:hypothetical protein D3C81_1844530 [compost metagenome]
MSSLSKSEVLRFRLRYISGCFLSRGAHSRNALLMMALLNSIDMSNSSVSLINMPGETAPSIVSCHRASASNPDVLPLLA